MSYQNEGTIDRFLRILIAAGLFGLAAAGIPAGAWVFATLTVAAILAITGIAGWCPLYFVLRLSTRPVRR